LNIDESYMTYYAGPKSDHFDGEKFFNPWGRRPEKGFLDIWKWRLNGERAEWPEKVDNEPRPPLVPSHSGLKATYIGHATILIQMQGFNILVDPVFSQRCSPFASIGPKRARQPFVPLDMLPKIDFVFISHNHYDHLDQTSLAWLARNHKPVIMTPLGNTRLIGPCADGCSMVALDWHQSTTLAPGLTLTLVPAQHWSRRGFSDTNRDLWGGFILKNAKGETVYYSGDSGFDEKLFKGIAERYGSPDLAFLPLGAYEPRWFMKYSHMNPAEAVQIHKIMQARQSMGFHFETFQLTDEAIDAPRKALAEALSAAKIKGEDFLAPYPGDSITVS